MVAYHETGHAIIGLKLENANIVQKVTIIPRGNAGGYNLMTPKEEKMMPTKTDFLAKITGYLGGRVAEELVFNEISAGASNDIQEATKIAKMMVRSYGMSKLGPIQYDDGSGNVFLGRDYTSGSNYSGEIAYEIDKEVRNIINECYERAKLIIQENRALLDLIANTLLEEETLTNEQIMNLVNYGKVSAPVKENLDEKPSTEVSEQSEVVDSLDRSGYCRKTSSSVSLYASGAIPACKPTASMSSCGPIIICVVSNNACAKLPCVASITFLFILVPLSLYSKYIILFHYVNLISHIISHKIK